MEIDTNIFKEISKTEKLKKQFCDGFREYLEVDIDEFIAPNTTDEQIMSSFEQQGYWSTPTWRITWNPYYSFYKFHRRKFPEPVNDNENNDEGWETHRR